MRAFGLALAVAVACLGCGTPRCPPGLSRCGGECVDYTKDTANCGACYLACKAGESCTASLCVAPKPPGPDCTDGVKNGTETAIDCGGSCSPCAAGSACNVAGDCSSGHCKPAGTCSVGTCDDGVADGDESDVDCGGSCPGRCPMGQHCNLTSDCDAGDCLPAGLCGLEGLTLGTDRNRVVVGSGVTAALTAVLMTNGSPIPNRQVSFSIDGFAEFLDSDGGTLGLSATGVTDTLGQAHARVSGVTPAHVATVRANADGHQASQTLTVSGLQQIVWLSTKCSGVDCTVMGSRGSGYNEFA